MSRSILRREPNLTELGRHHGQHALVDRQMTRTAFTALRVIRVGGHMTRRACVQL